MSGQKAFFAVYPGAVTRAERIALARRGFRLHENGAGIRGAYKSPDDGPPASYQVVRIVAPTPERARQRVIEALGREPDQLRVHKWLDNEEDF